MKFSPGILNLIGIDSLNVSDSSYYRCFAGTIIYAFCFQKDKVKVCKGQPFLNWLYINCSTLPTIEPKTRDISTIFQVK